MGLYQDLRERYLGRYLGIEHLTKPEFSKLEKCDFKAQCKLTYFNSQLHLHSIYFFSRSIY